MTTNLQQNAANVLETTRRVFVKARNVKEESLVKTLANPAVKLWTAEEIAKKLGMSLSFVYAHISKDKPEVVLKEGRVCYYDQDYFDKIASKPLNPRVVHVRRIRARTQPEQAAQPVAKAEGLFGRLESTENELADLKRAYKDLIKMLRI